MWATATVPTHCEHEGCRKSFIKKNSLNLQKSLCYDSRHIFQCKHLSSVHLMKITIIGNFLVNPLTLPVPCISESCIEIKIKLNFCFHTSLWCIRRFYKGLKALIKPFKVPQRSVKTKLKLKLIFSLRPELGREVLSANFTEWSNTLKQFVDCRVYLGILWGWRLKGQKLKTLGSSILMQASKN